jgi:hypothetical protein
LLLGKKGSISEFELGVLRTRKSGGRAVKECVLTWGDLALCLKGRQGKGPEMASNRSEKSAEVGSGMAANEGPNEEEDSPLSMWEALRQMPARAGRSSVGRGEASFDLGSDEANRLRLT